MRLLVKGIGDSCTVVITNRRHREIRVETQAEDRASGQAVPGGYMNWHNKTVRLGVERQIQIQELYLSQREDSALTKKRTDPLVLYKSQKGWKTNQVLRFKKPRLKS